MVHAVGARNGAVLVDDTGREQLLVGVWRTDALRAAMPAEPSGARLAAVMLPLDPIRVALPSCEHPAWFDCDTPSQLAEARAAL